MCVCVCAEIYTHGPAHTRICMIVFVLHQTIRAIMDGINQSLLDPQLNPHALTPKFMYRIRRDIMMRDLQLSASWSKHFLTPTFTGIYSQLLSTLLRAIHKSYPVCLSSTPDTWPFLQT